MDTPREDVRRHWVARWEHAPSAAVIVQQRVRDMWPSRQSVYAKLASHLVMGMGLGVALVFVIFIRDSRQIVEMIFNSASPRATMLVFVGSFMAMFGVGAALTGFIFLHAEEHNRTPRSE